MFRIAICDDSEYDLNTIVANLTGLKEMGVYADIQLFRSGQDLIEEYKKGQRFQCLILDMLMEPLNGIETAQEIRKMDTYVSVLIVTSTVQYALEGYQIDARRYLVKPVDKALLLKEVSEIFREQNLDKPNCFVVSNGTGMHKIRYADILFFESTLHMIRLRTMQDEYFFRGSVKEIESRMEPYHFFRVHKSYIVNLAHVKTIHKNSILMTNGESVFLSKHKAAKFSAAMLDYTEKQYDI